MLVKISPDRWPVVVGTELAGDFSLSAPGRLCFKALPSLGPETRWTLALGGHSGAQRVQSNKLRGFSVKKDPRL